MIQVSTQHRSMVVPYRQDLHTIIPHAKPFKRGNETLLAVPHRQDEVRLMRNLGIHAPAPILWQYDWHGDTPFDTQRETAALLSMNRRAYVLSEMGCVDADTEYLSPTGWVRIADYTGGAVAQYHPATGVAEFVQPDEFVRLPCDEMLRVCTTRGVDQLLSVEHRMLIHAYSDPSKQEVVEAGELYQRMLNPGRGTRDTISYSQATIPTTFSLEDTEGLALTDSELRVMVAVHADGYYPPRQSDSTLVHVRVKKQRKKDRLRTLLAAAGIAYTESSNDYPTAKGYTVFRFNAPTRSKTYAEWWCASESQRRVVADEVLHWDGSVSGNRHRYHTTLAVDADFIQFVFASTGHRARVYTSHRARRGKVETHYTVYIHQGTQYAQVYGRSGNTPRINIWPEPSTDGFKYCFRVPSTFLVFRRNGCIFASGNTGKTRATLHAANFLMQQGLIKRALIVAPLSTLTNVWQNEIYMHFRGRTACVLYGTRAQRLRLLEQSEDDFVIINHDGVKVLRKELMIREDINALILDELAVYRSPKADRTKKMIQMAKRYPYVWGLTGSPTPNAPTDAWAQARIVTPNTPPPYFTAFKNQTMLQISNFIWIPMKDSHKKVAELLRPAVRFTRDETVELPPVVVQDRHVEPTKAQHNLYQGMFTHMQVAYANHLIKAANEGVLLGKLLQVGAGAVYSNNGVVTVDNTPRLAALSDIITEAGQKLIVFVPYIHALEKVYDYVKKQCSAALIHGDVPRAERDVIFSNFQSQPDPHVIVAHPGTMAHGLTLTAANCVVWFSPIASLETYEQANARISRPGQTHKQLVINLWGNRAERKLYTRLKNKASMQGILLDMLEGVVDNV